MQSVLGDVANLSDLTAPSVVSKIERLEAKVSEFLIGMLDFADDERIAPLHQHCRKTCKLCLSARQPIIKKGKIKRSYKRPPLLV